MPMTPHFRVACLAVVLAAPLSVSTSAVAADAATALAAPCAACHGTDGRSPGAIPSIAGSTFAVLKAQLDAYKAGEVQGTTVMTRIAKGLSAQDIETLARYYAAQKK